MSLTAVMRLVIEQMQENVRKDLLRGVPDVVR